MNNNYKSIFKVLHSDGSGSCFYLKDYDVFVSNFHVVNGYRAVAIKDQENNTYRANVLLVSPTLDIALLTAEGDFSDRPALRLADGEKLAAGDKICVAGYPFDMPFSITEGIVSAPKQMVGRNCRIQTDAAVNPGNSGGAMLNQDGEVVGITVSKINDADNMGFGIRIDDLHTLLKALDGIDRSAFHVQCGSCEALLTSPDEFCPSCGSSPSEKAFREKPLSEIDVFVESAIREMGIDPIIARGGHDGYWCFYKGSSELEISQTNGDAIYIRSHLALLPKKDLEPVLRYLLSENFGPYKFAAYENYVIMVYNVYFTDMFGSISDDVRRNIVAFATKADEMDNLLVERFGCQYTQYSKIGE